jgi:Restriction endonuclease AspBHI N-terminal/Restriction endonuclease
MRDIETAWKIQIGDVFRVPHGAALKDPDTLSYVDLTKGVSAGGADTQKGMFFFASVKEPGEKISRLPAFIFHSNPYKKDTAGTPWIDVVEPDVGYALYHGDNRIAGRSPLASRGNQKFAEIQHFYLESGLRQFAPPILLFTQLDHLGNRKGYREFSGYGVPVRCLINTQREKESGHYFTNLTIELALFHLVKENEYFDWAWIDARRNGNVNAANVVRFAPHAWRDWVSNGESAIQRCRRNVARQNLVRSKEQTDFTPSQRRLLDAVFSYYENRKHPFEGLASYVAVRIIGHGCIRGWVTKRSGDMGIDFVCRLDIGDAGNTLSRAPVVVLGQAKCQKTPISAPDLARVVARLQRGWMGVYVTTGVFSEPAQAELAEDKYHLLLINGKRLAQELEKAVVEEGLSLREILDRETEWYKTHARPFAPERILQDSVFSSQADLVAHGAT